MLYFEDKPWEPSQESKYFRRGMQTHSPAATCGLARPQNNTRPENGKILRLSSQALSTVLDCRTQGCPHFPSSDSVERGMHDRVGFLSSMSETTHYCRITRVDLFRSYFDAYEGPQG